jgi:hypothetical protein
LAVFQPRPTAIVLASGRGQAPELKVPLVEHAVPVGGGDVRPARPIRQDEVDHHRGGMPLTGRDAGIKVAEP